MTETGETITRIYSGFRGVDFRGEESHLSRSPDSLNMWKDYKKTERISTRPGMKLQTVFDAPVYGIFFYQGAQIIHSGTKLYRMENGKKALLFEGVAARCGNGFVYENVWYFKDGVNYLCFDGEIIKEVEPYIPTTSIGRKPNGGGTIYEEINMLTGRRINRFLSDGESKEYFLDVTKLDSDFLPTVKVNDVEKTDFTVDYEEGKLTFETAPDAPLTEGQDNVSVEFRKTVEKYRDSILGCTLLQVFDNRVFVSGNKDFPNVVWHCSLNDPTYFSDTDYYREGMDTAQVKGLVAGNNALWVFRESSDSNTNVFYHTPALDDQYGKIYPSVHSSITIGCVGKAINFNDDIVFFSERGMEGISGDVTTEQVAAHRSTLVDAKMINSPNYKNMLLEEWEGYLLVFLSDQVFLADSRALFSNEHHMEYEWFYWEMEKQVLSTKVFDGVLYLGTEDGVYTLNDDTSSLESYWVTPKDSFQAPNKRKSSNKRGCVVEALGDISVYVKTENTEFEWIGTYESVTDYFTSRIQRKKFKDLQLCFHSNTRFSLETATLECFIGGYIKR